MIFIAALIIAAFVMTGCGTGTQQKATPSGSALVETAQKGMMVHLKQVLERYDANGQSIPQYFEIWLAPPKGVAKELDPGGKVLSVAVDTESGPIQYDAVTLAARKLKTSAVFQVNFQAIKSAYARATPLGELTYAGRHCRAWLLENDAANDWAKLYVDEQTGLVLLGDTSLFRLRTASLETLPENAALFTVPEGLKVQ
jgi:hypothetical protein